MTDGDPVSYGLPHRAPFVFVDRVLAVVAGERADCAKRFPADTPFFAGHFPGDPLVPGVILTEALAQTAGIAAGDATRSFRLAAIRQMKFLQAVRPDDEIRLEARKSGEVGGLLQFGVCAKVDNRTVAEGIIILSEVSI